MPVPVSDCTPVLHEMTSSSVCACKGVRTCLRCESLGNTSNEAARRQTEQTWRDTYQLSLEHACNRLIQLHTYSGPERCSHLELTDCKSLEFEGIKLIENFITLEQESKLVQCIDSNPWKDSQSGRRKQVRCCTVHHRYIYSCECN